MISRADKRRYFEAIAFVALIASYGIPLIGQGTTAAPGTLSYELGSASSSNPLSALSASQNPFLGSVPPGKATPGVMPISLKDAVERGLRYNLGMLLDDEATRAARGARWQALSRLMPKLNSGINETRQEIDLKALGFPGGISGIPTIVGPFSVFDARGSLSAPVLDLNSLRNERAASEDVRAARYTYQDARNLVVLVVGNAYLLANAGAATVRSAQAELNTAQALYQQALDRFHAGLSPQIDLLRAQVELKARQQRLIAARNDFATEKLNLARVIGLPADQAFTLTSATAYKPLENVSLEKALMDAYQNRPDYKAAFAEVRAAEARRQAVLAERYPSLRLGANFGDIGLTPANSHETFAIAGTLNIPVFQGGRIRGELIQADARLKQEQDRLANLKAQIDYDVRTALMNLRTAADQVSVAQSNVTLADQTLSQARDRFAAGVTDNIEVVQAQEAVTSADAAYISSLYQHNLAKVTLARAVGVAEQAVSEYLGGK